MSRNQHQNTLSALLKRKKTLIGVIHLEPLPGAPNYKNGFKKTLEKAIKEAQIYIKNGIDALIIENFGDRPLAKERCDPATIASISIIASKIRETTNIPLGINLLRNCAIDSLAVAYVSEANFIRVNAYSQTVVTDQGVIEPVAYELQRYKKYLNATDIEILADINVKHAKPLVERELEDIINETIDRAMADAIILTGSETGKPPELQYVKQAKQITNKPIIIGSGITTKNIKQFIEYADGFIVGTFFRKNKSIVPQRVRALSSILK